MIPVKEIFSLVRYKQKDGSKVKFSDYDLMQSLNECIRYINQVYAMKNSDFLEKMHEYRQDDINAAIIKSNLNLLEGETKIPLVDFAATGVDLPDDYISLVSVIRTKDDYVLYPIDNAKTVVENTYKILSNKLFSSDISVNMLYRRMILSVKFDTDEIDLPIIFKDVLVKTTGLILNNAPTDVLIDAINQNADIAIPARKYSNVRRKMPF